MRKFLTRFKYYRYTAFYVSVYLCFLNEFIRTAYCSVQDDWEYHRLNRDQIIDDLKRRDSLINWKE